MDGHTDDGAVPAAAVRLSRINNSDQSRNVYVIRISLYGRAAVGNGPTGSGADYSQTYEFIVTAVNNHIIRISGGALGFPVL